MVLVPWQKIVPAALTGVEGAVGSGNQKYEAETELAVGHAPLLTSALIQIVCPTAEIVPAWVVDCPD